MSGWFRPALAEKWWRGKQGNATRTTGHNGTWLQTLWVILEDEKDTALKDRINYMINCQTTPACALAMKAWINSTWPSEPTAIPKVNPTTRAYCSKGLWRVHEGLRTTTNNGSLNIYHWISAAKCQSECQLAWQMTMLLDSAEFEDPNAIKMVVRWVWILNRQTRFFSRQQNQETSYHWL